MRNNFRFVFFIVLFCFVLHYSYSQDYKISGYVKNSETGEAISGAEVTLTPGTKKTTADKDGSYSFTGLSAGRYIVKASSMGYETTTNEVDLNSDMTVNFKLNSGSIKTDELIVEINRAKIRETPVAFTNIDSKTINEKIAGQDAPMIVKGIPGMYAFSTDGVGNGESQLLVRGFNQNYVQVMINGIATNDPESNAVYWSNWGSVSSNAGSFQIQRGAGSSLYGAGSFGGSFNIITENPDLKHFYGFNLSLGSPMNTMYGVKLNSGLFNKKYSAYVNVDRKIAEGTRISGRYEGINYYTSVSFYPNSKQSVKFVLHGAPQAHGYSFSNSIGYFKKFGFDANSAPFLPRSIVSQLPVNKTTGQANYGLSDGVRELVDDNFVNLSHNFFHKPQMELHYSYDLNQKSKLLATAFYTIGRGGGSSITGNGNVFSFKKGTGINGATVDTLTTNLLGPQGYINSLGVADTVYLKNAVQKISYSFHSQYGLLTSYQTQFGKNLNIVGGAEFRNWNADHPGHFTNLFNKTSTTQSYAADTSTTPGVVKIASFNRRVYQGDLSGPGDLGNPFSWNLVTDNGTYRTQYRNYQGQTPQFTLFTQANYIWKNLNVMGSLQYVWYKYTLTERMPSENAIGKQLTSAQASALGLVDSTSEGARGDKFYMRGTNNKFYEFSLVKADRSRGFLQPKFGANFNATKNINVFANFAHVERFVDLSVYYDQGRVDPNVQDEKSNQYEFGIGWTSPDFNAKINGYYMLWQNKSTRIQDITQIGQPGYDRNGFRTELVGTSEHRGVEFEFSSKLDKLMPIKGLGLKGSLTFMDNKWKDVLSSVLTDPITGKRRAFNVGALNKDGNVDTLFFDQLPGTHVASGPQLMMSLGVNYLYKKFFAGIDMNYYGRDYLLDGDTYLATGGDYVGTANGKDLFRSTYDNKLPDRVIFDGYIGYNYQLTKWFRGAVSIQVLNLADKQYFSSSDRFGVIPGLRRSFRFNISEGL
jgi:outer membrane receptor protein involved in Fe transport